MARTLLALLWAWATLGFLCARSEAVGFEVVSPRTRVKPLARMQSAAAYCGTLDIFVVMGGFYNAKRVSYLSGDFWVYSFSDASWHNLGARYARRTFSPVKQFGASLTHIESVTSHCQFLVHSGKYADSCLPNGFGKSYLVDIRVEEGQYVVEETVLKAPRFAQAYTQQAVYYNNSVYFVGGSIKCSPQGEGRPPYYVFRRGVSRYNVELNTWERIKGSNRRLTARVLHLAARYDKPDDPQLLLHGGHDNTGFLYDVYSFSLTTFRWKRLASQGSKTATSFARMHVVGNLMYIYGGWRALSTGQLGVAKTVLVSQLGGKNDYGCFAQGRYSGFCEMQVDNDIGERISYASAVRQNKLLVFGGRTADSRFYQLDLTEPTFKQVATDSEEDSPFAILHIAFVIGISVCLLVTVTAVVQRLLYRRQNSSSQQVARETTQTASAGVSENDLKALPIVIYKGPNSTTAFGNTSTTGPDKTSDEIELTILDIKRDSYSNVEVDAGQDPKETLDTGSSSGDSTTTSSTLKSPRDESSTTLEESQVSQGGTEASLGEQSAGETGNGLMTAEDAETTGDMCAICISDYNVGDELRVLPCNHTFHTSCVDIWLKQSKACPMCKQDIVPS